MVGLSWCVPSLLSALSLFPWRIACKYGSISHFKAVFRGFRGVRVGLFVLGALRGLWGFCVREWLGGYMACCMFAFVFILLCLYFICFPSSSLSSGALPLLSSACPLVCLVCSCVLVGFVFSFSLADYMQKKGRKGLSLASSLRVLWLFRCLYSC